MNRKDHGHEKMIPDKIVSSKYSLTAQLYRCIMRPSPCRGFHIVTVFDAVNLLRVILVDRLLLIVVVAVTRTILAVI